MNYSTNKSILWKIIGKDKKYNWSTKRRQDLTTYSGADTRGLADLWFVTDSVAVSLFENTIVNTSHQNWYKVPCLWFVTDSELLRDPFSILATNSFGWAQQCVAPVAAEKHYRSYSFSDISNEINWMRIPVLSYVVICLGCCVPDHILQIPTCFKPFLS